MTTTLQWFLSEQHKLLIGLFVASLVYLIVLLADVYMTTASSASQKKFEKQFTPNGQ